MQKPSVPPLSFYILKSVRRRLDEILESEKQNHLMERVELCIIMTRDVELSLSTQNYLMQ